MFLCVSPNPAIDKRLHVPSLVPGQVIRASSAKGFPGGKAAHVAMVLRTLGNTPRWAGWCGGNAGAELTSGLAELGIEVTACKTAAQTRTNLEIIDERGVVTEILEPGEAPGKRETLEFENQCRGLFAAGKERLWVVFSGSLPPGVSADFYARLISTAKSYGCSTCVDAGGEPLRHALTQRPHFIKLNRDEAGAYLGTNVDSPQQAIDAALKLISQGARSAAVSLGTDGMVYCAGDGAPILHARALPVAARSTVGCGDSALAGFVHGIASKALPEETLRLATACAAANCVADSPGAARLQDIESMLALVRIEQISA